jgi:hypothetical protein
LVGTGPERELVKRLRRSLGQLLEQEELRAGEAGYALGVGRREADALNDLAERVERGADVARAAGPPAVRAGGCRTPCNLARTSAFSTP